MTRAFGPRVEVRPSTQAVFDDVARERAAQVARYGENDDLEFGTGPEEAWLEPYSWHPAWAVEKAFRRDYDAHGGDARATWLRLLREELAEVAREPRGAPELRAELVQLAALAVSMCERIDRDHPVG